MSILNESQLEELATVADTPDCFLGDTEWLTEITPLEERLGV